MEKPKLDNFDEYQASVLYKKNKIKIWRINYLHKIKK